TSRSNSAMRVARAIGRRAAADPAASGAAASEPGGCERLLSVMTKAGSYQDWRSPGKNRWFCLNAAMRVPRILSAVLCFVASGCVTSTFVLTDARYSGRPRTQPPVFIDRLPPFPYISIGVIEVSAPAVSDLTTVLTEAASKGGEVGCDVVVDRSIHRIASMIPNAGPLIAQVGVGYTAAPPYTAELAAGYTAAPPSPPAPGVYAASPPPSKREFICGVRVAPPPAPPA